MTNAYLKPKETIVYKASGLKGFASGWFFKLVKFVLSLGFVLSVAYLVAINFKLLPQVEANLGYAMIIIGLSMLTYAFNYFYKGFLLHPENINLEEVKEIISAGQPVNLWRLLSVNLSEALAKSGLNFTNALDSQHLTMAILSSAEVRELLLRLAIPANDLLSVIKQEKMSNQKIIEIFLKALDIAAAEKHQAIEIGDLFLALALFDPGLKNYIFQLKIEPADIGNVIYWQTKNEHLYSHRRKFLDPDNLALTGGLGRDWAYGYTTTLDQYCKDLSEAVKAGMFNDLELDAKDREIGLIEDALTRGDNHNVIIVGNSGVGKKTTVYGLAKKIYEGKTSSVLSNRRLLELDLESLLAGAANPNEIISRIQALFTEAANAGNIILFIENLSNLVSSDEKVGRVNAIEALAPFLEMSNIYIVGTTQTKDYQNYFAPNNLLSSRFVKVDLHEPSVDETIRIIEDVLPQIEGRSGVIVSYEAIKEATKLTDKLIQNQPQPQKTINLIDQASTNKAKNGGGLLMVSDIDEVISNQTNVPVGDIQKGEKQVLLTLEEKLHERVIGQKEAVTAIANALRRARAGVVDSKKPIGSFLFLGPTGVGKTETAKALASLYFKSEESMIRFDMSEYQQRSDIYRLIGDPNDKNSQGTLTSAIREHPFALILFDEVEKADKNILNLFLQILDEGQITDAFGEKCVFSNTIIILTSNAGSEFIRQAVSANNDYANIQKELINFVQEKGYYTPEFLNRFTAVTVFKPLNLPEITEVAKLLITKLAVTLKQERGVFIEVVPEAVEKLAQLGYDPEMGARPMQRSIQEHLENVLAKKLLSGEIKRGDKIIIDVKDLEI